MASGRIDDPLQSVQACVDASSEACYMREGVYADTVTITKSNLSLTAYDGETVAFDGSVRIDTTWVPHDRNVWRTTTSRPVWQLWIGYERELTMARWPNLGAHSTWDQDTTWGAGTIDANASAYSNGALIDAPHEHANLSADVVDATGAIAVLNVGSFRTWSRRVRSHVGDRLTYDAVPSWKTKHHRYFLEGSLAFLDEPGEWFYENGTLYLWPPENEDPNSLHVRGKATTYSVTVDGANHVRIENINFFGTTFRIDGCVGCTVRSCHFAYPSCSKRMLGVVDTPADTSEFRSSAHGEVRDCSFRFTDGMALRMSSNHMRLSNSYFYHIDTSVADNPSLQTTIQLDGSDNVVQYCTMHRLGASATINPGHGAIVEYNDVYDTGLLQSDGAVSQMMVAQQVGAVVRYNWFHDTPKYGARFDGNGEGTEGTMHHNVIWNCGKGIMVKGHHHRVFSNTVFDNTNGVDGNDILVMIEQGGNNGTVTQNNAANRIAGHRSGSYDDYPVPGTYSHNWNGYVRGGDLKDELVDPLGVGGTRDFRPRAGSALVDAGTIVPGIAETYTGSAPDIGAYEYGVPPWIPGVTWNYSTSFAPALRLLSPPAPPPLHPPVPLSPPRSPPTITHTFSRHEIRAWYQKNKCCTDSDCPLRVAVAADASLALV